MPVGPDHGASTFYAGEAEEAHPAPAASGVAHLERKTVNTI
ncbi:hypothetical protein [Bacillus sp. P14.5]|nr:hypothetical protein [Bacillus sp. P14.5]